LGIQLLFSIGLGICLGVLNVFFRDVSQLFNIFLQFWFWFTPIVYPISILPEYMRTLLQYNPMTNLITSYQNVLVYQQPPNWQSLWPLLTAAIALCFLGLKLYRNHASEMVDEL
jgi:lipopolysaccharide transport system permease protein